MSLSTLDRYRGCLLGLACGDAVGTTVEFSARGSFPDVTDMVGGGPFELPIGAWTDDTSMALCLASSLVHCQGFDAVDQMNRYVNWWRWGYLSSTHECFDIGTTVRRALQRYQVTGDPMAGDPDPSTAGNGSLMRLAPVVLAFGPDGASVQRHARSSSMTTHAAPEAIDCCDILASVLLRALLGAPKTGLLPATAPDASTDAVRAIVAGTFRNKPRGQIRGSGYCVESLEAAMWCFEETTSYEAAVLAAANLGDDADTTAAIVGQIAGAFYGVDAIPAAWRERVVMASEIVRLADALHGMSGLRSA